MKSFLKALATALTISGIILTAGLLGAALLGTWVSGAATANAALSLIIVTARE